MIHLVILLPMALSAAAGDPRPKTADAETKRVELHEMIVSGKIEEAERELERLLSASGDEPSAAARWHLELGMVRFKRREGPRALGHLEAAVDEARRAHDPRLEAFARRFSGDIFAAGRDMPRAKAAYEEALRLARATGDKEQCVELEQHIAAVRGNSLDAPDAVRLLEDAVTVGRKFGMKDALALALMGRATVREKLKNFRGALADINRAEEINRGIGKDQTAFAAMIGAAAIRVKMEDYPGAIADIERAVAFARERKQASLEVDGLTNLASLRQSLGELAAALEPALQARSIAKARGNAHDRADAARMLGIVYDQIGDYSSALEMLEEALALRRKLPETPAHELNSIGIIHTNRGEGAEAVQALLEANALKPWRGGTINLGDAYMVAGRYKDAHLAYQQVNHRLGLGRWQLLHGSVDKAREIFLESLPQHQQRRLWDSLTANYTALGLIYEKTGHPQIAVGYYRRATEVLERMRDALAPDARLHFMGGNDWLFARLEPYEGLVRVTKDLAEGPAGAFQRAEFTRSRAFAEAAAARVGRPETRIPRPLAERERGLATEIARVSKKLDLTTDLDDVRERPQLDARLRDLKKERDNFVAELRRDHPAYAAVAYPQPVRVDQAALEPDEALIEFEVTEPYTRAFVVRGGSVTLTYDIGLTRGALAEKVLRYRRAFEGVNDASALTAFDPALGRELYRLLLAPALEARGSSGAPLVDKDARILVAPDEILGILPFESLVVSLPERLLMPSGRHGPAPAGVRYVADDWDVAYVHSATALTVLRSLRTRPPRGDELLVLADPIFDASDPRSRGEVLAQSASSPAGSLAHREFVREMGLGGARGGLADGKARGDESAALFPRLDRTSELARALVAEFGNKTDGLVGFDAKERSLRQRDIGRYRYLVFATHGLLSNAIPGVREPALVLTQLGNAPDEDGFLTMSEVLALHLDADVAALTACQTGLGRMATGEGVMGLGRAFQEAGARHVLMSLWSVSEDSTTDLATRFFKKLKSGLTPRRALREARAELRREGWEHPYFWAPFILVTS
ncbi:MAG: CHAT domain-containing protein [Elusimicrobia bacterium]|nr:CHAT domain-containing protein [Elusimicrobiota bacterium]